MTQSRSDSVKGDKEALIGVESGLSLKLLLAVGGPVLGGTLWIQMTLLDIATEQRMQGVKVELVESKLESLLRGRLRRQDMEFWALLLSEQNPDLTVPQVPPGDD